MLAEIGYFHGYKGYRFSGSAAKRIPYTDFDELCAVVEFDTALKAMFYPALMRLEMALKNLAMLTMLEAAGSSHLADVFSQMMPGNRRDGRRGKLEVIHTSNGVLLASYKRHNVIVRHYYDSPAEAVPLWALMEVITLGHFARLLEQLSSRVLNDVARSWGLHKRDADLIPHLVLAMTDLRNCVAHNGTVFDTRFATAGIRKQVPALLVRDLGLPASVSVGFRTITDYFILVIYLARGLGFSKREASAMIKRYSQLTDELHARVPTAVFDMIVHTDNRAKIDHLESWLRTTWTDSWSRGILASESR